MSQREGPREGGDLHLTCVANKYLYTGLSWQRLNSTEERARAGGSVLSSHQFTSGEFSNSLVLLLNNLTAGDSGTYRCSAHHLITGQETHLETQVVVTGERRLANEIVVLLSAITLKAFGLVLKNDQKLIFFPLVAFSYPTLVPLFYFPFVFLCPKHNCQNLRVSFQPPLNLKLRSPRVFCTHTLHIQTNTHSLSPRFSAWELGPLDFLGPHPAFALALQLSTSFTWE